MIELSAYLANTYKRRGYFPLHRLASILNYCLQCRRKQTSVKSIVPLAEGLEGCGDMPWNMQSGNYNDVFV